MAKNNEINTVEFEFEVQNNDTGSLKAPRVDAQVGDEIVIEGEARPRTITYTMGKGEKQHLCCKGTGPMPVGLVRFGIIKNRA